MMQTSPSTQPSFRFLDTDEGQNLLIKAEHFLDSTGDTAHATVPDDIRTLIHKLQVYQTELEMQNEELQLTQQLLTKSRARYIQLFQNSPFGMAVLSQSGILEKVNETFSSLLGQNSEELTGSPIYNWMSTDSKEIFLGRFRAFFKNPKKKALQCTYLSNHEDNRILQMQGSRVLAPLVVKSDKLEETVLLVCFQDITKELALQQEMAESRNELDQIFDSAIPLQVISLSYRVTKVNKAFCSLFNRPQAELAGQLCYELWPHAACKTDRCALRRIQNGEECCEGEKELVMPNGETRRYLVKTTAARDQSGRIQGMVKAVLDITDRTRTEQALALSEERFRSIIENTSDLILTFSMTGEILFANQALLNALGFRADQLTNLHFKTLCHPNCLSHCSQKFQEMVTGSITQSKVETIFRASDGHEILVEGTVNIQTDEWGKGQTVRGIFRDITMRRELEDRLRQTSITDELTGLLNRRGFMEMAEKALDQAERDLQEMPLFFVDLDGMKAINDSMGHSTGDQALVDMANILRAVFRQEDLIARLGGDEFVALLTPNPTMPDIPKIGTRLDEQAFRICHGGKRPYRLSMSIGTEIFTPGSSTSLEKLLSKADSAMYTVKEQRKSRRGRDITTR